jgi:hypothetical protein
MKKLWHPVEGFEVLRKRFGNEITYAAFANNIITAGDALNMLINVITKIGYFQAQYEEWHSLPKAEQTLTNTFKWWGKRVQIKNKFAKLRGNMGLGHQYRMSSTQS